MNTLKISMIIKAIIWPKLKKNKKIDKKIKPWMFDYIENQYLINDSELYSLTHETIKKITITNQPVVYNHNKNKKVGKILNIYTFDDKLIATMEINDKKYIKLIMEKKIKHVSPLIMYYKNDTRGNNPYLKEISLCEYPYFKDNKIIEIIASEKKNYKKKKKINDNLYTVYIMTENTTENIPNTINQQYSEKTNFDFLKNDTSKQTTDQFNDNQNLKEIKKNEFQIKNKKRELEDNENEIRKENNKRRKLDELKELEYNENAKKNEIIDMLNEKNKKLQEEIRNFGSKIDKLEREAEEKNSNIFLSEYKKYLPDEIPKECEEDIKELYKKDIKNGKQGSCLLRLADIFNRKMEEVYLKANDPSSIKKNVDYKKDDYKKSISRISDMVGTNAWNNMSKENNKQRETKGKNFEPVFNIEWLNQ